MTDVGSLGEAIAGSAAVVALVYAGRQLRLTRTLERDRLFASLRTRINSRDFQVLWAESRDTLGVPTAEHTATWETFCSSDAAEQAHYVEVMNFVEELAFLHNRRSIDPAEVREFIGDVLLEYWGEVRWFVRLYRAQFDSLAFVEWERMNESLRSPPTKLRLGSAWRTGDLFGDLSSP